MAISRKALVREQATETLEMDIPLVDPTTDKMASEKIALLMRLGAKASPYTLRRFFNFPLDISQVLTPNLSNFDPNELASVLALTIEFFPPENSEKYNHYLELFRACLARGANTNASVPYVKVSGCVRSPLDFALASKSSFIVLELLKHGAKPTRVIEFAINQNVCMDEFNELCDHIQQQPFDLPDNIFKLEHQEKIERLLRLGANIPSSIEPAIKAKLNVISLFKPMLNELDPGTRYSIILKIMSNYNRYHSSESKKSLSNLRKLMKHCIHAGTDINQLSSEGWVHLHNEKIPQKCHISQNTLLHRAIGIRQPELITLLIREGADITIKDCEGRVPLHPVFEIDTPSRSAYFKAIDKVTQFQTRRVRAYYAINAILTLNNNLPPFLLSYLFDYIVGKGKGKKVVADYHRITNSRFLLFREPIPSEPTPPNPLPLPTLSQPGS